MLLTTMPGRPIVELVYFAGCPRVEPARLALRRAFAQVGVAPSWREWDQTDPETPAHLHGLGSPTILIGGRDVTGHSPTGAGRACRADDVPAAEVIAAALAQRSVPPPSVTFWASAGGVLAALLGSVCCMGPVLTVALGLGAGIASTFEPVRPLFGGAMLGLFAAAFYAEYGGRALRRSAFPAAGACAASGKRAQRAMLWITAAVALLLWTFPIWSAWLG
jgi:mercuric ion transport protein